MTQLDLFYDANSSININAVGFGTSHPLYGAVPPQKTKIFESPDKGKTIYERDFGSTERRLIKTSVQQQWNITFNGMKV